MKILTPRQAIIVRLIADGHTNKQISVIEGIGQSTVATHIEQARWTMGAENRAHLVAICIREGEIR